MTRLLAVLVGLIWTLPVTLAAAPPAPSPGASAEATSPRGPTRQVRRQVPPSAVADFKITVASEIRLNGRQCRFKDVPNNAVITKIEVDPDTREILTVHFRTQK